MSWREKRKERMKIIGLRNGLFERTVVFHQESNNQPISCFFDAQLEMLRERGVPVSDDGVISSRDDSGSIVLSRIKYGPLRKPLGTMATMSITLNLDNINDEASSDMGVRLCRDDSWFFLKTVHAHNHTIESKLYDELIENHYDQLDQWLSAHLKSL